MKIGRREVGPGHPTFILAEAGTNHLGDVERASAHVRAAANAGCDGIKFQCFRPDAPLFCPLSGDENRRQRWNKSYMDLLDWRSVRIAATESDMALVLSLFQIDAIDWWNQEQIHLDAWKVASRANRTFPYEKCKGPFIVSLPRLGPDAHAAKSQWRGHNPPDAVWLECLPKYPSPLKESPWRRLYAGLSDHSGTPWPAIDACFKGAALVEVHFALDPKDAGPDAPVCLTPAQLKLICEARDAAAEM